VAICEEGAMRLVITAATLASAMLTMISVGYAQNDQPQSQKSNASTKQAPREDSFWPTPAQEEAIPYRPCNANVELANGQHECLNGQ
jgi:hypothetical protein